MAEKNGVYKTTTTHLVTIVVTVAIAWFSFGGGISRTEAERIATHAAAKAVDSVPNRGEVSRMIATEPQYLKDKSAIEVRLKNIEDMVSRMENIENMVARIERKLSQ